jgi:hypothetical protein
MRGPLIPSGPDSQFVPLAGRLGVEFYVNSNISAAQVGGELGQLGVSTDLVRLALLDVEVPGTHRKAADMQFRRMHAAVFAGRMEAGQAAAGLHTLGCNILRANAELHVN